MPVQFKNNPDVPDIIELKGVTQSYDGGKTNVIEDLDLLVENEAGQNQLIALLGPSGCGKSTLLKYISGLKNPTKGEVLHAVQAIGRSELSAGNGAKPSSRRSWRARAKIGRLRFHTPM